MRVSVVITSYNYAAFLGRAVESALSQADADVEVIAVDDGSTDDSPALLRDYEQRGVKVILQSNRGQGGALNAGYAASRGEVIIFLDSDDVLLPRAAVTAAAAASTDRRIVQVHWPVAEIDRAGVPTGEVIPVAELAQGDLLAQLIDTGPLQWSSSPTSGNAWTRRYLDAVMPIPEAAFRGSPDAYLIALAPLYGRVRALNQPHTQYRLHGANLSNGSFDEGIRCDLDIAGKLFGLVAGRARALGLEVNPDRWRARNWSFMIARSLEELDLLVGRSMPFVLIDDQQLSLDATSGRRVIPFLEHEGEYWGHPADDANAIEELERLRRDGARFLVLAWPAFWWREAYLEFISYLHNSYPRRLANERLEVFELVE